MTTFLNDDLAPADSDEQAEAMAHDALVFEVSSALARLDGCDDPHHLIWEGGPVPEPWGEVWQRYEPQAKEVINTIGDGLAQAMVEALRPHGVPAAPACVCDNGHRPTNSECPVNANGPTFGVTPSQDERTRQFFADVASSPEKARAFLQDAGILDERGDLAEPYRADGVKASPYSAGADAFARREPLLDTRNIYRHQCPNGERCLNGCHRVEPCLNELRGTAGVAAVYGTISERAEQGKDGGMWKGAEDGR